MRLTLNIIYLLLLCAACLLPIYSQAKTPARCVILLHGLGRSHHCMSPIEETLMRHHYIVINRDYPSTTKSIKDIADFYLPFMINECKKHNPRSIDFVTHSMGGIILQTYLQNHKIEKLDRIIMMSPPNHGSPVADILHKYWLYQAVTGPAGQELTTYKKSTPHKVHLLSACEIGVIAGTYNFVPFGNYMFQEANDGAVSVSSAKTNLMKDFIALPVSHSFMMDNPIVQRQILYFLSNGRFFRNMSASSRMHLSG